MRPILNGITAHKSSLSSVNNNRERNKNKKATLAIRFTLSKTDSQRLAVREGNKTFLHLTSSILPD